MDAEDLAKVALTAIDDWLDQEIVGLEGEEELVYLYKGDAEAKIATFTKPCFRILKIPRKRIHKSRGKRPTAKNPL